MSARNLRVHVYDDNYEVLRHRMVIVAFDIDAVGVEAIRQESTVDAMLHALRDIAERDEGVSDRDKVRLELCDIDSGDKVYDWIGR